MKSSNINKQLLDTLVENKVIKMYVLHNNWLVLEFNNGTRISIEALDTKNLYISMLPLEKEKPKVKPHEF